MTITPEHLREDHRHTVPVSVEHRPAPVLVTEQQVLFASALAISAPLPAVQPNLLQRLISGLHHLTLRQQEPPRAKPRHHPQRTPVWYSDALMAREMWRL